MDQNINLVISTQDQYSKGLNKAAADVKKVGDAVEKTAASGAKIPDPLAKAAKEIPVQQTIAWHKGMVLVRDAAQSIVPAYQLIASAMAAIQYESSLADIGKVADFADADALAAFGKELQVLSRQIPLTVTELAAMAEAGGQMGIASDQLDDFVQTTAKMATAFKMTGEQAGQSIGTMMTLFSMSVPQVERLGDAINVLGNTTNAKERDIIDVLTRIGGIGQQFGLSANELSALAASFLSLGKTPETAGTAINALLSKLSTANVQSKEFKETLTKIGTSASEMADAISTDPTRALDMFLTKLQQLPKQTQGDVIGQLFGAEFADDVAALVQSLDSYRQNLGRVADQNKTAGAMQSEFSKRLETTQAELDLMRNALNEIAVNLGSTFLPAVRAVAQAIASVSQAIADLLNNPFMATAMIAGLAAIAAKGSIARNAIEGITAVLRGTVAGAAVFSTIGGAIDGVTGKSDRLRDSLSSLSRLNTTGGILTGLAALTAGFTAGGAAVEYAFAPAIDKIKQTEQNLTSLNQAQRDWTALMQQAGAAGMSNAQLEQIRQIKIETLNTQQILQQQADFDSQRNKQAMDEVKAQIAERTRLRELLAAKVAEKANAEAALEKAKQEEITQARTKGLQDAKASLDDFVAAKRKALEDEQTKEKDAIERIKQLRAELYERQRSDADRLRELQRRDMSESEQQADIAQQTAEKLAEAQSAMGRGDASGAAKLADQAKTLAERLKDSQKAMELFKQASNLDAQANQMQQAAEALKIRQARAQQIKITADISGASEQIAVLEQQIAAATRDAKVVQMEAAVEDAQSAIAAVQGQLDAMQDKTITVTVVEKTVQARRWGGMIYPTSTDGLPRFRRGGKLPGYGGGDRIHALLEAGEFVVRKEAVSRYGVAALQALNTMKLPRFQTGGVVGAADASRTGIDTGEFVNIRLDLGGGRIVPFTTRREQVQGIKDAFAFIERGGLV